MAKCGSFVSYCRSKASIIFNGLIILATLAVLILYYTYAFQCPCSAGRNFDYGWSAICTPAGLFFFSGILINRSTRDLVSECRLRKCQKLSGAGACTLMGNIVGRAVVAPLTWVFISLLDGQAYVCAFSETIDANTLKGLDAEAAKFPCFLATGNLGPYWSDIEGRLKHNSQMVAWSLMGVVSLMVLLVQCACPSSNRKDDFWTQYYSSENVLFERTLEVHAHLLAAENVKSHFGFVVLDEEEKGQLAEHQTNSSTCSTEWNGVTGINERSAFVQHPQKIVCVQSGERREVQSGDASAQLIASSSSVVH